MTDFPTSAAIEYVAGEASGTWTAAVKQFYDAVMQMAGAQAATEVTIDTGVVTPTLGAHTVDTEADAASDDLATIAQDNLPDGFFLFLSAADASRVVTVKNAAGGAGQILTTDGADFVLDAVDKWIWLKRAGTSWEEVLRSYGADLAGLRTFLGLGAGASLKHNLAASAAPTTGDDSADGYTVGSSWFDVTNKKAWVCLDATEDAAVWREGPVKHKRDATAAPTATDDSAAGYAVGSTWSDVTNKKAYVCLDATATAAVWGQTNGAAVDAIQVWTKAQRVGVTTLTSGTTITIDCDTVAAKARVTLDHDATFQLSNLPAAGEDFSLTLEITQGTTGGTGSWSTDFNSDVAIDDLSTGTGKVDLEGFTVSSNGADHLGSKRDVRAA